MTVAICDDENTFVKQVQQMLNQYGNDNNIILETDTFNNGKELISELKSGTKFDLVLLDICMPDVDGINVGKCIRDILKDNITQIVYISSNEQYAMELFQIRPMNFLIKPVDKEHIYKMMDVARKLIGEGDVCLTFKTGRGSRKIGLHDIRYISIDGRKTVVFLADGNKEECYGKIDEVYDKVKNNNFVRVHKSYIVNCNYVNRILPGEIVMDDGKTIPVSRSWKEEVSKICQQF